MATPHVAGLAALALSANPNLTAAELRSVIVAGADQSIAGSDSVGGINAALTVALAAAGQTTQHIGTLYNRDLDHRRRATARRFASSSLANLDDAVASALAADLSWQDARRHRVATGLRRRPRRSMSPQSARDAALLAMSPTMAPQDFDETSLRFRAGTSAVIGDWLDGQLRAWALANRLDVPCSHEPDVARVPPCADKTRARRNEFAPGHAFDLNVSQRRSVGDRLPHGGVADGSLAPLVRPRPCCRAVWPRFAWSRGFLVAVGAVATAAAGTCGLRWAWRTCAAANGDVRRQGPLHAACEPALSAVRPFGDRLRRHPPPTSDTAGCSSETGVFLPSSFSMSRRHSRSSWSQNETAMPVAPARPVRPMRCTYVSATFGKS